MGINREGRATIILSVVVVAIVGAVVFLSLPIWLSVPIAVGLAVLLFFIVFFFRDPKREKRAERGVIFAPADGEVVVVERVFEEEFLKREVTQVSVFMSVTNVHINWYPVGGRVEYFKHHNGRFRVAWHPKSSQENERTTIVINSGGEQILFRQVAGFVARRVVCYAEVGAEVEQNDRVGFIKFGSRVDLFLPHDSDIEVKVGDKVVGSQSVVARLRK